tara:strand:+ start:78 stop:476 length:399 start_codon:yes stop_codon:yes gene_type:complete
MKLTTDNILKINNYLIDLVQECNRTDAEVELGTSLSNALTHLNKEDNAEKETFEEMKQYEFQCEIELYPLVQYIEANTAEEAIELMEQQIEDTGFMQDLTSADFHCEKAEIVKTTKEYKQYIDAHKKPLKDK